MAKSAKIPGDQTRAKRVYFFFRLFKRKKLTKKNWRAKVKPVLKPDRSAPTESNPEPPPEAGTAVADLSSVPEVAAGPSNRNRFHETPFWPKSFWLKLHHVKIDKMASQNCRPV
jgi:hypothetical protein